jgi:hypothetical protein
MIRYNRLAWLQSGDEVGVNQDATILRVSDRTKIRYFSTQPVRRVDARYGKGATFEPVIRCPEGTAPYLLVIWDFDGRDALAPNVLRAMRDRATSYFYLDLDDEDPSVEAQCTAGWVISERGSACRLLGTITKVARVTPKEHSVVAVFDVLGFGAMLRTVPAAELHRRYRDLVGEVFAFAGLTSKRAIFLDGQGKVDPSAELWKVSFGIFSDTIVMYPKRAERRPLQKICEASSALVDAALAMGWPLRGAIGYGTFRADREMSLYVGTAVADAHEQEMSQDWCGCTVTAQAAATFADEVDDMLAEGLLLRYPVPLKADSSIARGDLLALNWAFFDFSRKGSRVDDVAALLDGAPLEGKRKLRPCLDFIRSLADRQLISVAEPVRTIIGDKEQHELF